VTKVKNIRGGHSLKNIKCTKEDYKQGITGNKKKACPWGKPLCNYNYSEIILR